VHAKLFVQCSAALFNWVPRPCPATGWVVRLRVGRAGKATAPPPPSLSLVSSPRTNAPSPFLLLSSYRLPPSLCPSPPRRRFLLLLLPRITPSTLLSAAEVSAAPGYALFGLSSTSSSTRARLLELRFRCFGFAFA
jgi:hypothetical protein